MTDLFVVVVIIVFVVVVVAAAVATAAAVCFTTEPEKAVAHSMRVGFFASRAAAGALSVRQLAHTKGRPNSWTSFVAVSTTELLGRKEGTWCPPIGCAGLAELRQSPLTCSTQPRREHYEVWYHCGPRRH